MYSSDNSRLRTVSRGLAGAFALAIATALPTALDARPFKDIICLGDSLSDTGRFYEATGGTQPPLPYSPGRFSNGPVWNEHLADMLDRELNPDLQYAFGGSLTNDLNYNSIPPHFILPGFEQQVDEVIADGHRGKVDPTALYTIWIGANDFFAWLGSGGQNPGAMIAGGVNNTVEGIAELAAAGARYFVVFNLPDLGKTPAATMLGPQAGALISALCAAYNDLLADQLDLLEWDHRLRIVRVDAFGLINDMVANPADYGFTNVTSPALYHLPAADPDTYLFWDPVHPTTAAHEYVAEEALEELRAEFPSLRPKKAAAAENARLQAAGKSLFPVAHHN